MIHNCIVRDHLEYAKANRFEETVRQSLKEQMRTDAIHDNGIYKTFAFSENCYDLILDYIKIEDKDIELHPDMFEKRFDTKQIPFIRTDQATPEYKDILESCIMYNQTGEIDGKLELVFEEIKKECVKKHNAVYSTVNIDDIDIDNEAIFIQFSYRCIKDDFIDKLNSDDVIFGEAPLPYGEWFNSDSHSTDDISRRIDNITLSKRSILKNKIKNIDLDCSAPILTTSASKNKRYYTSKALYGLKENKNMNIHLLIVPEGMNEEFVNNTKKSLQSNANILCVSSNDIAFEPSDKYKTKYDLFEYWLQAGLIHTIEFMLGYENDPEAKVLEAFIRGIRNNSSVNRVILLYQKDNIEKVVNNLRNDYVESSEVNNKLHNITDRIMDKVKFFKEYGLEDDDFDKIRNANCTNDACNAAVLKITKIAFASDKKGSKGSKK